MTVTVVTGLALASIAAARGQTGAVIARAETNGIRLHDRAVVSGDGPLSLIGIAPGRWLAIADKAGGELEASLRESFGAVAAVCDQSAAFMMLEVAGPRVRDGLAKLFAIDLEPATFAVGDAATTTGALIGVTLWRSAEATYRIAVGRSFAPGFLRALIANGAEYGVDLISTP